MSVNEIPEPCENDCIGNLIDPACEKCMAHYQYWADVDSSDDPFVYELSDEMLKWLDEADAECPDPTCICKKKGD